MPPEKAQQVAQHFVVKKFAKNDYLLKEGKVCKEPFFIEEGLLRAYVIDVNGNEVTTNFYSENIFANDFLSFFKRIPSNENNSCLGEFSFYWIAAFAPATIVFLHISIFKTLKMVKNDKFFEN